MVSKTRDIAAARKFFTGAIHGHTSSRTSDEAISLSASKPATHSWRLAASLGELAPAI